MSRIPSITERRRAGWARELPWLARFAVRDGDKDAALEVCRKLAEISDEYALEPIGIPSAIRRHHDGVPVKTTRPHECAVCGNTIEPGHVAHTAIYHRWCKYPIETGGGA